MSEGDGDAGGDSVFLVVLARLVGVVLGVAEVQDAVDVLAEPMAEPRAHEPEGLFVVVLALGVLHRAEQVAAGLPGELVAHAEPAAVDGLVLPGAGLGLAAVYAPAP